MVIKIKNLRLRTIVGVNGWERKKRQAVVINVEAEFDGTKAARSDRINETLDYKMLTKAVIRLVEGSRFFLLEKLADAVLKEILRNKKVKRASVEVDKPEALRFAESVSVQCSTGRNRK